MCKAVFEDNSPAKASGTRLVPERGLERNRVEASKLKKKKNTHRERQKTRVCVCVRVGNWGCFFCVCLHKQQCWLHNSFSSWLCCAV